MLSNCYIKKVLTFYPCYRLLHLYDKTLSRAFLVEYNFNTVATHHNKQINGEFVAAINFVQCSCKRSERQINILELVRQRVLILTLMSRKYDFSS